MIQLARLPVICLVFACLLHKGAGPATGAPALWQASDDDTEIHIFGTLHLLEEGITWENARISKAFTESDALVVELDDRELAQAGPLFAQAGRLETGQTMRALVGNGIYNDVVRVARQLELPEDSFAHTRPWFAGMSLTVVGLVRAGYDPASGIDKALIDRSLAMRKPILGIETAEQQVALFSQLKPAQEKALLVDTLKQSQNVRAEFSKLQAAWLAGDIEALDRLLNRSVEQVDGLGEALLYARNRAWAAQLALLMEKPGRFFVAVGAAHLAGEKSLIRQLDGQGLAPIRLQ
jgi:uncharacterized protein YbaP (TraB family)